MADATLPAFPIGRDAAVGGARAPNKPTPRGTRNRRTAVAAVLLYLLADESVTRVPHALAAEHTESARETYPFGYCEAARPNSDSYTPHPTYTLAMAQVVTRHGDRTAINLLPNEAGVQWDCAVRSRRAMAKADDEEGDRGRDRALHDDGAYLIDPEHPYAHDFWAGNCSNGQLTARGFEQQVALGEVLRQLYVLEQGLLPRRLKEEDVWVRSTDVPRTRESALGMLLGLYPAEARVHGQTVRTWRKPMVIEDMLPNPLKCPRYEERRQELTASAEFQQRMQRTQPLRRQLERVLHTAGVSSFAADFDSYVDNLMTRACHAKPLPCDPRGGGGGGGECLTLADARAVLDEGNWQYSFMHQDEELNQLSSGHFLWALMAAMTDAVEADDDVDDGTAAASGRRRPPYKLGVFGGHDTTVAPLIGLITGGIPDSNWPPYASNVVLELWKPAVSDEEAEEEAVVRVLYNGVPTRVKGCGGAAMRDLFKPRVADTDSPDPALWCPFSQWKAIVGEYDPRKMTQRCLPRQPATELAAAGGAVTTEKCAPEGVMPVSTAGMLGMASLVLVVAILVNSAMALLLPKSSSKHR